MDNTHDENQRIDAHEKHIKSDTEEEELFEDTN